MMLAGSGDMAQKHVAFAPASQKQLGSSLRSPLLYDCLRLPRFARNGGLLSLFRAKRRNLLRSSQRPLSLSRGFFTTQPSPSKSGKGNADAYSLTALA